MREISKLQIGDIGFSFNRKNILSRIIFAFSFWRTKEPFSKKISHAFIYMGDGLIAEASTHGIGIVSLKKYLHPKYDLYFKRYSNFLTIQEQQTIWMSAADEAGLSKYSYLQLFVFALSKIFNVQFKDYSKYDKVCSEFVSETYKKIGVNLTSNKYASNDTPLDLFNSEKLKDV